MEQILTPKQNKKCIYTVIAFDFKILTYCKRAILYVIHWKLWVCGRMGCYVSEKKKKVKTRKKLKNGKTFEEKNYLSVGNKCALHLIMVLVTILSDGVTL